MTEAEWLACEDPELMVIHIVNRTGRVPARKIRLFTCACCRRLWERMPDQPCRAAVEFAERHADGEAPRQSLAAVFEEAEQFRLRNYEDNSIRHQAAAGACCTVWPIRAKTDAFHAAVQASRWISGIARKRDDEFQAHCDLMRDIFGNPYRLAILAPTCRAPGVLSLAQAAYEARELPPGHLDNTRLAILSDALEEAGCTDEELLGHLRSQGPHVRGCWVLDLVLGKN